MGYSHQTDASACGVFVMMYIAYLTSHHENKIKDDVNMDNNTNFFRKWLARMICENDAKAKV
jgi:hypothetical protein